MRRLKFAVALAVLSLLTAPAFAEDKVTSLLAAVTADTTSSSFYLANGDSSSQIAVQAVYTGTVTVTLEASLDGTNWYVVQTWDATKKIFREFPVGGMAWHVKAASCSGCSVTAKVTASASGQIKTF